MALESVVEREGKEEGNVNKEESEAPACIWDHFYEFCGVKILIHEGNVRLVMEMTSLIELWSSDYDAGLGGTMFDGALCLCNFIEHLVVREEKEFKLCSVVELGAGCGLPGLLLAGLGARVVLTDVEETVELIEENIENNEKVLKSSNGEATAETLDWTNESDRTRFQPPYDYVLAADTVYSEEAVVPFLKTVYFLAGLNTVVVFAHPAPREPKASELFWSLVDNYFDVKKVRHFVSSKKLFQPAFYRSLGSPSSFRAEPPSQS